MFKIEGLIADLIPPAIARLPRDARGYPIPWFTSVRPGTGPDLRYADSAKRVIAFEKRLCWICGRKLDKMKVFVGGPFCFLNRVFGDWCCHEECAAFALAACPFLNGQMQKRGSEADPERDARDELPGQMKDRSAFACLYFTKREITLDPKTKLFFAGPPWMVEWWKEGHPVREDERAELAAVLLQTRLAIDEAEAAERNSLRMDTLGEDPLSEESLRQALRRI